MKRWRSMMPRFREPIIVKIDKDGTAGWRGTNTTSARVARVLKPLETSVASNVVAPRVAGPVDNNALPVPYDGWSAWWDTPPNNTRSGEYVIPDPPTIDFTIEPTEASPILWEASCEVGTNVWSKRIVAFFARVEWNPVSASEMIKGQVEMNVNLAKLKIRPAIFDIVDVNPQTWNIKRVADNTIWKLGTKIPSFRRGDFIELLVSSVNEA